MKIAFISQYFYPEPFSNTAIAKDLISRGHEVTAFPCVPNYGHHTFYEGYSNKLRRNEIWDGIQIHRTRTLARGRGKLGMFLNYLTYPFAGAWTVLKHTRKNRPDVSFVSMPSPLLQAFVGLALKKVRGVPCVYWVQDIWPESLTYTLNIKTPLIVKPLEWVCGWLYRQADLVLVQSTAFPDMIARFNVPSNKIRVLPNTAPSMYHPIPLNQVKTNIPNNGKFTLMFAGNIGQSQDFDTLIRAAKHVKFQNSEIHWVIIGDGRDKARVEACVTDEGLSDQFTFLGRKPQEDIPAYLAQADAAIVSLKESPIFSLTVPYKVQCYMACATPIIASVSGESLRIVSQAQAGISVPAEQPQALADAILRMAEMPRIQRRVLGENGRRYFNANYSANYVYEKLNIWLKEVS